MATVIILFVSIIDKIWTAFAFLEDIYGDVNYGKAFFPVILKVLATAYIADFTAQLCRDSGENAIASKVEVYTPHECILDFSQVSFMDSSGIAVVINALRYMNRINGLLSVTGLNSQPMRVFLAAGMDKLVEIKEVVL